MRIILDTNVFISGIFFSGPPSKILKEWRNRKFQIVLSQEILSEYRRVANELLLNLKEYKHIKVLSPRRFVETYLK